MQIEKLSDYGCRITDVFKPALLEEICNLCNTFEADSIRTNADTIREVINLYNTELRYKVVHALLPILKENISVMEMWRDHPGYANAYHVDDPVVQNIIIVYLGDEELGMGTGYIDQEHYTVPYKKNTAIMLLNSDKIIHGLIGQVPDGVIRKTLYINWRNNA